MTFPIASKSCSGGERPVFSCRGKSNINLCVSSVRASLQELRGKTYTASSSSSSLSLPSSSFTAHLSLSKVNTTAPILSHNLLTVRVDSWRYRNNHWPSCKALPNSGVLGLTCGKTVSEQANVPDEPCVITLLHTRRSVGA